jgi:hypothetical protein
MGAIPNIEEKKNCAFTRCRSEPPVPPLLISNISLSVFLVFVTVAGRRATDWATGFDPFGVV